MKVSSVFRSFSTLSRLEVQNVLGATLYETFIKAFVLPSIIDAKVDGDERDGKDKTKQREQV